MSYHQYSLINALESMRLVLLLFYCDLLHNCICYLLGIYPEYNTIQPWRFHAVPKGYWESSENCRRYFDWLADALKINKNDMSEWINVKILDVRQHGGIFL